MPAIRSGEPCWAEFSSADEAWLVRALASPGKVHPIRHANAASHTESPMASADLNVGSGKCISSSVYPSIRRNNIFGGLGPVATFRPRYGRISILREPEWRLYSRPPLLFFSLSANAAALILAAWTAVTPPEAATQSRPGIDMQVGHNRLIGLVGRNSGVSSVDFGIFLTKTHNHLTRNPTPIRSLRLVFVFILVCVGIELDLTSPPESTVRLAV